MSVGLGFFNEYRSELAVEALHSQLRHTALAIRGGEPIAVDVTELVPGDLVRLAVGDVVPADLRLVDVEGLECDESVLTGEALPAEKRSGTVTPGSPVDLPRAPSWARSCGAAAASESWSPPVRPPSSAPSRYG